MQKRSEDEPFMEIKIKTGDSKTQLVLMSLQSKRQIGLWVSAAPAKSVAATIDRNEISLTTLEISTTARSMTHWSQERST
eukprot:1123546-Rhodomonas_salina.2